MSNEYDDALREATRLQDLSEDSMLEQLGLRIEDRKLPGGEERSARFEGDFSTPAGDMGPSLEALKRVGRVWWEKLEPQLMAVLCDPHNEDREKLTGKRSVGQIAAALATSALVSTLAPPAWLIVAATIMATKIADTGLEAMCQVWSEAHAARAAKPANS